MSKHNNGGPAFPTEPNTQPGSYVHHGMSLRDWFAGQALGFVIATFDAYLPDKATPENFATESYRIADAMLAAREKGGAA